MFFVVVLLCCLFVQLLTQEAYTRREDDIAVRVKQHYPGDMHSPVWSRWTNTLAANNDPTSLQYTPYSSPLSLTHIVGEYFRTQSVGDLAKTKDPYLRWESLPGYPGTLSPGLHAEEEHPIESLPRRLLHPWPAMQQIPFHVRWPVSSPLRPPPLLWFALNDMFLEVSTHLGGEEETRQGN